VSQAAACENLEAIGEKFETRMPAVDTSRAPTSVTALLRSAAAGQTSPEREEYDFSWVATPPVSG
jgi:hypothetical protein